MTMKRLENVKVIPAGSGGKRQVPAASTTIDYSCGGQLNNEASI
jgi:hypothetical protein